MLHIGLHNGTVSSTVTLHQERHEFKGPEDQNQKFRNTREWCLFVDCIQRRRSFSWPPTLVLPFDIFCFLKLILNTVPSFSIYFYSLEAHNWMTSNLRNSGIIPDQHTKPVQDASVLHQAVWWRRNSELR